MTGKPAAQLIAKRGASAVAAASSDRRSQLAALEFELALREAELNQRESALRRAEQTVRTSPPPTPPGFSPAELEQREHDLRANEEALKMRRAQLEAGEWLSVQRAALAAQREQME